MINEYKESSTEIDFLCYIPFYRFFRSSKVSLHLLLPEIAYVLLAYVSVINWPYNVTVIFDYLLIINWLIILLLLLAIAYSYKPSGNLIYSKLLTRLFILGITNQIFLAWSPNTESYFWSSILAMIVIGCVLFAFFWKTDGNLMGFGSVKKGAFAGFLLGFTVGILAFITWSILSLISSLIIHKLDKEAYVNNYRAWYWLFVIFVGYIFSESIKRYIF